MCDAIMLRLSQERPAWATEETALHSKSSESPQNLFTNAELASALLSLVSDFESRLMQLVDRSEKTESPDEHKKFTTVGSCFSELGDHFLYPVYRRHRTRTQRTQG